MSMGHELAGCLNFGTGRRGTCESKAGTSEEGVNVLKVWPTGAVQLYKARSLYPAILRQPS
jgi:hypothetical protein